MDKTGLFRVSVRGLKHRGNFLGRNICMHEAPELRAGLVFVVSQLLQWISFHYLGYHYVDNKHRGEFSMR